MGREAEGEDEDEKTKMSTRRLKCMGGLMLILNVAIPLRRHLALQERMDFEKYVTTIIANHILLLVCNI